MADEPLVTISTAQFEKAVGLYMAATRATLQEALSEEWPFLIRKIMDFTPPFQSGGAKGSTDQAIGRAAVNRDIRRTMRPFAPLARTWGLAKILSTRDIAAFNALAAQIKTGPMAGARAVHFSPSVHKSQRNANGRIGVGSRNVVLGDDAALLKNYIKREQGKVGIAKSGWWPALALVGGDAPAYVTKHGIGNGSCKDERADELNPSLTATNRTPWAVRKDEAQRIIQASLASRAVAITSKVRTKLRLAAKQAELDQRAA